jgi:hypothetical protein
VILTETRMGTKPHSTFVAAGLPAPSMRLEALIGGGTKSLQPAVEETHGALFEDPVPG